jgi:hypothetical protein
MAGSAVLGLGLMSLANVAMATELSDKTKCLQDNQKYRKEYTAQLKVNNKTYTDGLKAAGVVRNDAEKVAQDNYKAAVLAAKNKLKADLGNASTTPASRKVANEAYTTAVKTALATRKTANENLRQAYNTSRTSLLNARKTANDTAKATLASLVKVCQ